MKIKIEIKENFKVRALAWHNKYVSEFFKHCLMIGDAIVSTVSYAFKSFPAF
jgi:hypothetical protein